MEPWWWGTLCVVKFAWQWISPFLLAAKIRKFWLQLLWHYHRQPLGIKDTWHLQGLMSRSKKIQVVANNWVQEGPGVCALFGWNLKLFAIGVRFFATSLHHTPKLFPRSQRGHEWVRNKKNQHGTSHVTPHITIELSLFPSSKSDDTPVKRPSRPLVGEHWHRLPGQFLQNNCLKGLKVTFSKIELQKADRTDMLNSMTLRFRPICWKSYWPKGL